MAEPLANGEVAPGARLDALRESGADRSDPIRFAYLAALARRAADQPETIRRLLNAKIMREADDLAARHRPAATATEGQAEVSATGNPLAALLAYVGDHAVAPPTAGPLSASFRPKPHPTPEARVPKAPDLKSVAYFRETWSRLCAEQQLTQTLAQAPDNAGPMNSQHLVLRALQAMRDRAPDYLQGFMSYVDTLIWLEHAASAKSKANREPAGEGDKR